MDERVIMSNIKSVLNTAPHSQYTTEIHLKMIKYADQLKAANLNTDQL